MDKRKLLVYLIVPAAVSLALTAMYFSGNIVLQRIVCPKLPPLSPDAWREFGLLEGLQNVVLLALAGVACAGALRKRHALERAAWAGLAVCTLFVFAEEIDYGAHLRAYFFGGTEFNWFQPMREWPPELVGRIDLMAQPVNVHNQPGVNKVFKKAGDLLIGGVFVLLPLLAMRFRNKWLQYAAPDRYAILTVIAIVLLRSLTHALGSWEESQVGTLRDLMEAFQTGQAGDHAAALAAGREPGAISSNLSEFRELNFYYLLLVYCAGLVFCRRSPLEPEEVSGESSSND
ncbi:MAG TPA: hypothetical protein P5069_06345 [Candidatus Hydrogenedentes bacterium]|nr:hypothetical protein [Candidatus Hydrogenedentota bacterium]HRZ82064.1 hypothetical protein [Candidatus Hydrogenedentota bacterium]